MVFESLVEPFTDVLVIVGVMVGTAALIVADWRDEVPLVVASTAAAFISFTVMGWAYLGRESGMMEIGLSVVAAGAVVYVFAYTIVGLEAYKGDQSWQTD